MTENRQRDPRFHRRRFLQIIAAAGAAGGLYQLGAHFRADTPAQIVRESRQLMGTQVNLVVCGPDRDACYQVIDATLGRMQAVEQVLSRYLESSQLSRLNRHGQVDSPSSSFQSVLDLAGQISGMTGGAFDITVLPLLELYDRAALPAPEHLAAARRLVDYRAISWNSKRAQFHRPGMGITVDGIGKGYIVDQGVEVLQQHGFQNVYVEAGGDLMVSGSKPQDAPWRIGVRNPRPENTQRLLVMEVNRPTAIATSGDYLQWYTEDMLHHHIIDPRTGISPPELASATVTAPSVALADGLATAAMVMGPTQAMEVLEAAENCEGLLIGKDLRHYRTSGFQG